MSHMSSHVISHTVWCRYNAVNFITNIHKRHPMARPLRRGMGCLLWIQHLIDIMSQFLQFLMQNLSISDRVLTALDCIMPYHIYHIQYIIYIYHSIYHINYQILYHILYYTMHHIIFHICHISLTSQRTCYLVDKGCMNLPSTQELDRYD